MSKKKYNHAYTIGFSLISEDPTGEYVTQDQVVRALLLRIEDLMKTNMIHEAIGMPFDTYEEETLRVRVKPIRLGSIENALDHYAEEVISSDKETEGELSPDVGRVARMRFTEFAKQYVDKLGENEESKK